MELFSRMLPRSQGKGDTRSSHNVENRVFWHTLYPFPAPGPAGPVRVDARDGETMLHLFSSRGGYSSIVADDGIGLHGAYRAVE